MSGETEPRLLQYLLQRQNAKRYLIKKCRYALLDLNVLFKQIILFAAADRSRSISVGDDDEGKRVEDQLLEPSGNTITLSDQLEPSGNTIITISDSEVELLDSSPLLAQVRVIPWEYLGGMAQSPPV